VELVKNKATGKFFVVLDDDGGTEFLVITPEGKIRQLERHLFGAQDVADPKDIQWRQQLTEKQVDIYETYFNEDR
jgi:hypothetical protein